MPGEVTHFPDKEGWVRTMQPIQESLDGSPLDEDAPKLDQVSPLLSRAGSRQPCHVGPRHVEPVCEVNTHWHGIFKW